MTPAGWRWIGPLLVAGMEICWMLSALWLVEERTAPGKLHAPVLVLSVPIAFILGRLGPALSRPLRLAAGLAEGLVWVLLMVTLSAFSAGALAEPAWPALLGAALFQSLGGPNPLLVSALAAAAWIAGLRLAALRVGSDQILGEFQFGLLILLGVSFCAALWGSVLPLMLPVVFGFFLLFLTGMAAARSRDTVGWLPGDARSRWLAALVFNTALVLGAGLLLTVVVNPGLLALILGFLETLWDRIVEGVVRFIAFLAQLIPQPEIKAHAVGGGAAGPAPQDPSSLPDLLSIPDAVRRIAGFLVSAFWFVLLVVCLWRMASQIAAWLRRQMTDMADAEIETLKGSFRQDLLRLLHHARRRVAGWIAWLRYTAGRRPPAEALPPEAAAVRRLYRSLLAWSAAAGCPRRRHQTPHEFLGRL
jgi:hypothetical protein